MSNINRLGEMGRSRSLHGICIKVIVRKKSRWRYIIIIIISRQNNNTVEHFFCRVETGKNIQFFFSFSSSAVFIFFGRLTAAAATPAGGCYTFLLLL